ncbi:hypothetical protein QBC43DRAFT_372866 [Cladorrhinum sp. PSN259]|nr:hypothetical protein QBC43DRAFT_372866 [Cladorrhinum sp. PSN259]
MSANRYAPSAISSLDPNDSASVRYATYRDNNVYWSPDFNEPELGRPSTTTTSYTRDRSGTCSNTTGRRQDRSSSYHPAPSRGTASAYPAAQGGRGDRSARIQDSQAASTRQSSYAPQTSTRPFSRIITTTYSPSERNALYFEQNPVYRSRDYHRDPVTPSSRSNQPPPARGRSSSAPHRGTDGLQAWYDTTGTSGYCYGNNDQAYYLDISGRVDTITRGDGVLYRSSYQRGGGEGGGGGGGSYRGHGRG